MSTPAPSAAPYGGMAPREPVLVQIGDVTVSRSWVVTPRGTVPLAGSEWWVTDRAAYTQAIPVWAIVLAVLLFPIGLLFLLVKETRLSGWVEVMVRSGSLVHVTAVPADSYAGAQAAIQVEYVRGLVHQAGTV